MRARVRRHYTYLLWPRLLHLHHLLTMADRRDLPYISPIFSPISAPYSPLYLPHISPTSPLYLPCISPVARRRVRGAGRARARPPARGAPLDTPPHHVTAPLFTPPRPPARGAHPARRPGPLYLACISPRSPIYLPSISPHQVRSLRADLASLLPPEAVRHSGDMGRCTGDTREI